MSVVRTTVLALCALLLIYAAAPAAPAGRVTMDFKDARLADVLHMLSRQCGVSIVLGGALEETVTVNLVDLPFEEALDIILATQGYRYYWANETVVVDSRRYISRVINLHYIDARKVVEAVKGLSSEGGLIQAFAEQYTEGVTGGGFAGKLIVVDRESKIDDIVQLVEALDVAPRQITIEAKLVETTLGEDESMGIRWNLTSSLMGATVPTTFPFPKASAGDTDVSPTPKPDPGRAGMVPEFPPGEFFPYASAEDFVFGKLSAAEFSLVIEALESRRNTNLVSAPKITTLDNTPAEILVGEQVPVALYERHKETGVMEIIGYEQQEVGIRLWVTPHMGEDGRIMLEIMPEASSIVEFIGQFNERPVTSARTARTKVLVKDGETAVIGGLIREVKREVRSGVPLLSRIPLLGKLFSHKETQVEKVDLLIFITPRIVEDIAGEQTK